MIYYTYIHNVFVLDLISEGNEMMVTFRSNYTVPWSTARRGFKAYYMAGKQTSIFVITSKKNIGFLILFFYILL